MLNVSQFLTIPVISLYDSKNEGIVKNLYFSKNLKKLKWIVIFSNNEDEEEKVLNTEDIFKIGENALVIKCSDVLNLEISTLTEKDKPSPINCSAFSTQGKFLGLVKDIVIDEKFYVKSLLLDNGDSIEIKRIASCGTDAIIIQDEQMPVKIVKCKKKNFPKISINKSPVVKILSEDEIIIVEKNNNKNKPNNNFVTQEEINNNFEILNANNKMNFADDNLTTNTKSTLNDLNQDKLKISPNNLLNITNKTFGETKQSKKYVLNEKNSIPNRISTNYKFLIGRIVEQNIYSQNNVILAKKGTKINEKTIDNIKQNYKLQELIKFSK